MAASVDNSDTTREELDPIPETHFFKSRGCFCFPCFGHRRAVGAGWWERVRAAESEEKWWSRGFAAVRKARELSEIAAGPKWKTFIRRFNRSKSGGARQGKFQYDPLSYALNFDEGQNGDFEDEADLGRFRDFSARYAAVSGPVKAAESGYVSLL